MEGGLERCSLGSISSPFLFFAFLPFPFLVLPLALILQLSSFLFSFLSSPLFSFFILFQPSFFFPLSSLQFLPPSDSPQANCCQLSELNSGQHICQTGLPTCCQYVSQPRSGHINRIRPFHAQSPPITVDPWGCVCVCVHQRPALSGRISGQL